MNLVYGKRSYATSRAPRSHQRPVEVLAKVRFPWERRCGYEEDSESYRLGVVVGAVHIIVQRHVHWAMRIASRLIHTLNYRIDKQESIERSFA